MAVSVGIGLGAAVVPGAFINIPSGLRLLFENGIVVGSVSAIALNLFLNKGPKHSEQEIMEELKSESSIEAGL